jgi:hypothetical protein
MRAFPFVLSASARALSEAEVAAGAEAEVGAGPVEEDGAEDGAEGEVEVLALVLRKTSRIERREAGAREYRSLSSDDSGSIPNASAMHWTGTCQRVDCMGWAAADARSIQRALCRSTSGSQPPGLRPWYLTAPSYSPATSRDSLSSSLTVPSSPDARRNSMLRE